MSKTKSKIIIIIACIAILITVTATKASAADLDTPEVTELRVAKIDCVYKSSPDGEILEGEPIEKGDTIYMIDKAISMYGVEYLRCNTENGERYLLSAFTGYGATFENEQKAPIRTYSSSTKTVSAYCSACDRSGITASGKPLAWGRVASNDYAIGTRLYVEGYGECVVEDRMRDDGKVDVYIGDYDTCQCGSLWGCRRMEVSVL